jgi:hypothetical protein
MALRVARLGSSGGRRLGVEAGDLDGVALDEAEVERGGGALAGGDGQRLVPLVAHADVEDGAGAAPVGVERGGAHGQERREAEGSHDLPELGHPPLGDAADGVEGQRHGEGDRHPQPDQPLEAFRTAAEDLGRHGGVGRDQGDGRDRAMLLHCGILSRRSIGCNEPKAKRRMTQRRRMVGRGGFPGRPLCGARDEPVENFLDNAPVSQRFRRGYRLIRGVWCCQGAPVSPSVGQAPAPHLPRSHRLSWRHLWVRERATTKTRLPGRAPFAPRDVRSGSGVFGGAWLPGRRSGVHAPPRRGAGHEVREPVRFGRNHAPYASQRSVSPRRE